MTTIGYIFISIWILCGLGIFLCYQGAKTAIVVNDHEKRIKKIEQAMKRETKP